MNEYEYIIKLHLNENLDILDETKTKEENRYRQYDYLFLVGIPYLLKFIKRNIEYNEKDFILVFLSLYIEYLNEIMEFYGIIEDGVTEYDTNKNNFNDGNIKTSKQEHEDIKEQYKQYQTDKKT